MALYVRSNKAMGELRRRLLAAGIELSEADVRPTDRFLMERFITGSIAVEIGETDASEATTQLLNPRIKSTEFRPTLSALSFDIETDMKAEQLYSIGVYSVQESVVFMLGDAAWREKLVGSEDSLQSRTENSRSTLRESSNDNSALRIEVLPSERAVITAFIDHVARIDPDVTIGWNVVNFDLRCLQRVCDRLKMKLSLGRATVGQPQTIAWREARER